MPEMSRGEMVRNLDAASKEVLERLTNGSLEAEERHALARTLIRLLPLVDDDLQDQEDIESATRLSKHLKRWDVEAEAAQRLDIAEAKDRTPDESEWT
jgi:hypothetical protein